MKTEAKRKFLALAAENPELFQDQLVTPAAESEQERGLSRLETIANHVTSSAHPSPGPRGPRPSPAEFRFELGSYHHTFTATARCPRTGRFGIAVATSDMGVGGRVPFISPNIGAVATQAFTDPRLGPLALRLLDLGYPAARVLSDLQSSDDHIGYRQIAVVDRWGHAAVSTGEDLAVLALPWAGHLAGPGWVVMGNAIVGEQVVQAMAKAMQDTEEQDIYSRLMATIEAGAAAGGQPDGQRSAGLLVYENEGFAVVNLRVDDHPEPTNELRRLFDKLYPLIPYYRERPDNPTLGRVKDWAKARGIEM